jgi:cyclic-di-GMP phosphodiesterase, flagellum assembly factor TipF
LAVALHQVVDAQAKPGHDEVRCGNVPLTIWRHDPRMPPFLLHASIVATYGAAALTAGVTALDLLPGLGQPTILALAGCQFLACGVAHQALARLAARRGQHRELVALRQSQAELYDTVAAQRRALEKVADEITEVRRVAAEAGHESKAELMAELRVLESLLGKLAGSSRLNAGGTTIERAAEQKAEPARSQEARVLDVVKQGLAENRIDLYLQPVVSLPQRKTRYFEAFSRVRDRDGELHLPESYLPIAASAGLAPTIDNLLLFRCVQLIRKVRDRRRDLGMFVNIAPHSLADQAFFEHFLDYMGQNRDLGDSVIFEFAQDAMMNDSALAQRIERLGEMGFRLSMDRVTSLNLDFEALRRQRIDFVKIDASVLLSPAAQAAATIDATDLKDALARHGIDLIVEKVEQEKTVVELLDYGVDFGQGFLFGEPRLAREPEKVA